MKILKTSKKEKEEVVGRRNILLEGPELISSDNENTRSSFGGSFSFFGTRKYHLGVNKREHHFIIEYFDRLPDELTNEEKKKFIKEEQIIQGKKRDVYVLKYGSILEAKKEISAVGPNLPKDYRISPPRDFKKERVIPKPEEINVLRLANFIKDKKILFYTGAGISVASGVPNMEQLINNLQIDRSKAIDGFAKRGINNPEEIIKISKKFSKAASESKPTPAHKSLTNLAQKLNCKIFTENLDRLHEKTGIKAIHISSRWLKENLKEEWLKDLDAIITVGLSYDDRGFLAWYKKNNPDGKILAINLQQSSYLGNEDIFFKGDLQKIIPELEKNLTKLNKDQIKIV